MSNKWARSRFILRENPSSHLDHAQSVELLDERDQLEAKLEANEQTCKEFCASLTEQANRHQRAIEEWRGKLTYISRCHNTGGLAESAAAALERGERILKGKA